MHKRSPDFCLIETMRLERTGQVLRLALHLQRLRRSAQQLGFSYEHKAILQALAPSMRRRYHSAQRLRLSLAYNGAISIQQAPLTPTATPVLLRLSPFSAQPQPLFLRHKTDARHHWHTGERFLAQHPNYFDVIYYDQHGYLTEGTRTNIYLWTNGQWVTPPATQDLLAGVQRQYLINKGWVQEQPIHYQQLLPSSRLRVSNALRGWLDATLY